MHFLYITIFHCIFIYIYILQISNGWCEKSLWNNAKSITYQDETCDKTACDQSSESQAIAINGVNSAEHFAVLRQQSNSKYTKLHRAIVSMHLSISFAHLNHINFVSPSARGRVTVARHELHAFGTLYNWMMVQNIHCDSIL